MYDVCFLAFVKHKTGEGLGMTASVLKRFFLVCCVRGLCFSRCLWLFFFSAVQTSCQPQLQDILKLV